MLIKALLKSMSEFVNKNNTIPSATIIKGITEQINLIRIPFDKFNSWDTKDLDADYGFTPHVKIFKSQYIAMLRNRLSVNGNWWDDGNVATIEVLFTITLISYVCKLINLSQIAAKSGVKVVDLGISNQVWKTLSEVEELLEERDKAGYLKVGTEVTDQTIKYIEIGLKRIMSTEIVF